MKYLLSIVVLIAGFGCKEKEDVIKVKASYLLGLYNTIDSLKDIIANDDRYIYIITTDSVDGGTFFKGNTMPQGWFEQKGSIDSVGSPILRYFLVSYEYRLNTSSLSCQGMTWFDCNGFPQLKNIESVIYKNLPLKRSCYQPLVITSIFEFKDKNDYETFSYDKKGDSAPKHQKECEN